MKFKDFKIGIEFKCGNNKWRCTDIGTRVITAICIDEPGTDESWFIGPPYTVVEYVFDENDIKSCSIV